MIQGYQPTAAEIWICDLYTEHGITHAGQLDFSFVAAIWGIQIIYNGVPAFSFWAAGMRVVSLDSRDSREQQRADFFHELGHVALHDGNQRGLHPLMVELQERQARRFQLIAAMPYRLLPSGVPSWEGYARLLSETFAVPADVAARRVEMIRARRPYNEGRC